MYRFLLSFSVFGLIFGLVTTGWIFRDRLASALRTRDTPTTNTSHDGQTHYIRATRVQRTPTYQISRSYIGTLESQQQLRLAFQTSGTIARILVEAGDRVDQGDILALLDSSHIKAERAGVQQQLEAKQAQLAELQAEAEEQPEEQAPLLKQPEEQAPLLKQLEVQIHGLEAELAQLDFQRGQTVLSAPFRGAIANRHAERAATVSAGMPIVTLIDTENFVVTYNVSVEIANKLAIGDSIELLVGEQATCLGILEAKLPMAHGHGRRTLRFSVEPAAGDEVLAGDAVLAEFTLAVDSSGVWIPTAALTLAPGGYWSVLELIRDDDDDVYQLQRLAVDVVHSDESRARITGDFSDELLIAADGLQRLVPGQRIRVLSEVSQTNIVDLTGAIEIQ